METPVDPAPDAGRLSESDSPQPPAWWTGMIVSLALTGAFGVGYVIGRSFGATFPSHEYQLRKLAVGERFVQLRYMPPPAGIDEESWRQMTRDLTSAFSYATYTQSRTDLKRLNQLGKKWNGLDWQTGPPNVDELRRVLQDMAEVVGADDEYFAGLVQNFEAAAGTSSGE